LALRSGTKWSATSRRMLAARCTYGKLQLQLQIQYLAWQSRTARKGARGSFG
jgi:hypothetical protein